MEKKLIIGMVGVGLTAHLRCYALKEIPGSRAQIKGAYSRTRENLMNFSKEMSVKVFNSLEEMLEDQEINTISVNIPNNYHYEVIERALEYNKNIIVEYPMVTGDHKKAEKLLKYASKKDLFIHVGHTMNYDNDLRFVIKNKKYLGNILAAYRYLNIKDTVSYFDQSGKKVFYKDLGSWYSDSNKSGGWIATAHYHYIQIFRRTMGEVVSLYAVDSGREGIAMGSLLMKHENNAGSAIQWGFPIPGRDLAFTLFTGTRGSIEINNNQYLIYSNEKVKEGMFPDNMVREVNPFIDDWKFLFKKIDSKEIKEEDDADMLKVLKISIYAQRSATSGREISIK
jgi:predicted dehydrogenase